MICVVIKKLCDIWSTTHILVNMDLIEEKSEYILYYDDLL